MGNELQNRRKYKACAIDSGPKSRKVLYWTVRKIGTQRWVFEDGWDSLDKAEKAAKYYRDVFKRRCIVIKVPAGENKAEVLKNRLGH